MFQNDYLMRMIYQITHYIARIVRLQQEQKPQQGYLLLGQGYELFFGLSIDTLDRMSAAEWLEWLRSNDRDRDEVIKALFEFLQVHIELLEAMHSEADADQDSTKLQVSEEWIAQWRLKKIQLYLHVIAEESRRGFEDSRSAMIADVERLQAFELPADSYAQLMWFLYDSGCYADAEDLLYQWAETVEKMDADQAVELADEAEQSGRKFYESLLNLTDQQLEAGEWSREEAQIGLEQWLTRKAFQA